MGRKRSDLGAVGISFLEDLRSGWKPEFGTGEPWVEEGVAPPIHEPVNATVETERLAVSEALLATDEEMEIAIGDVVRFVDVAAPLDVLTLRIVRTSSDLANGLISSAAPLAQTLLGAVVGDEVSLHVPGSPAKTYRILDAKRPS